MRYTRYGETPEACLTSIPRPLLRQNLADLAEQAGARLHFHSTVIAVEPDRGRVVIDHDGTRRYLHGDLIAIADGLRSVADPLIGALAGQQLNLKPEPRNYLTAMLAARIGHGLSLQHLHYWHQPEHEAYAIGVANHDGSVAVLLISRFSDIDPDAHPFPTPQQAERRLSADFPQLLQLDPGLTAQLPGRERGRFSYKSISTFAIAPNTVVIGDAGRAAPPWAGFGANTALYGASSLIELLVHHRGDLNAALPLYDRHQSALSRAVLTYVDEHGEFLSSRVAKHPDERARPALAELITTAHRQSHDGSSA